jgi:nucleotide-binding universal stress UspA family protein
MVIVCGTDFTEASFEAASAAAAIAARARTRMLLVHVLDFPDAPEQDEQDGAPGRRWRELFEPELERRRTLLQEAAKRLTPTGAEVEVQLLSGAPDETLVACARERGAQLIAVASHGRRSASTWRLGSVADRLALTSPVPLLIVRSARPFETWSDGRDGGRPLRVMLGADFGVTSRAAAEWIAELKTSGPCELIAAHVYEQESEARRLGVAVPQETETARSVERALGDVWRERLEERVGSSRVLLRQRSAGAQIANELVDMAEAAWADVLVVGTHQRKGLSRHWHGSVSYSVLPLAAMNVVVVPVPRKEAGKPPIPRVRRILAVTDLSEQGNRAVSYAFAQAPPKGQVTVLHVHRPVVPMALLYGSYVSAPAQEPDQLGRELSALRTELEALVQNEGRELGIETRVEVLEASDVPEAVCQQAERMSADMICMSTRGHGRMTTALLGSTAQGVVRRSGRPVLLIGPTDEP